MKTVNQVMTELKKKGNEKTRKTYARHGAANDTFGVSIADLKTIAAVIRAIRHRSGIEGHSRRALGDAAIRAGQANHTRTTYDRPLVQIDVVVRHRERWPRNLSLCRRRQQHRDDSRPTQALYPRTHSP